MSLTYNDVKDAFTPTREIQSADQFVGRRDQLRQIVQGLGDPNSFMAVYGLRGVGKSSVAYQVKNIAAGDEFLKSVNGLDGYFPKKGKFDFLVHYLRCDKSMSGLGNLIQRILFGDEENPSLFSLTRNGDVYLKEIKKTLGMTTEASFFGIKIGGKKDQEVKFERYLSDDFVQKFRSLLGVIRKDNSTRDGIVIILDEFDVIKDKSGFASIVKSISNDYFKFCIVGIAGNLTELMGEHSSLSRQLALVSVPKMEPVELAAIVNRAEHKIGRRITFQQKAIEAIVQKAYGFPYFVHLIGRACLVSAVEKQTGSVSLEIVEAVFRELSAGRLSTIYDEIYHSAVKSSPQREILLRLFSEVEADEIETESVYRTAKELEITNPSQLMKELTTPEVGEPVLVKLRDGCYQFNDPVFKVYARLRSWKH